MTAPRWIADAWRAAVSGGVIDVDRVATELLSRMPRHAIAQVLRGVIGAVDPAKLNAVDIDGATSAVCAALMQDAPVVGYDVIDRLATVADEAFGPFPVLSPDEYLTELDRGIFELRKKLVETENKMIAMKAPGPDDLTDVGLGTVALMYHADEIDCMIAEIRRRRGAAQADPA